ncbi:MAG: hypothetical protein JSV33_00605 [bacterium]|nr:MAG: hypothetical protein JSV33_00605 [bacterium]
MKTKVFISVLILLSGGAQAQISGTNILEYQLGNLPYTDPSNLSRVYDQLSLSYDHGSITGFGKFEIFQAGTEQRSYSELTQRSLRFSEKGFEITVGNFYEMFGRGLLLRSYELPGTILEDIGLRIRYGFYRDVDGFLLKYETDYAQLKLLRGKPLRNDMPPTPDFEEMRRTHVIEGAEADLFLLEGWSFGGAYLRDNYDEDFDGDREFTEYGTFKIEGNLPFDVQIYSEYALQLGENNPRFDILSDKCVHAFYSSMNFSRGPVGLSVEFKDYNDFLLGFNDPPYVVKEHSYRILNRSTHTLVATDEMGWQAEMLLTSPGGHTFTLNLAEAENEFGEGEFRRRFLYKEIFAEIKYHLNESITLKGFIDRSQEPIKLEMDRYAFGLHLENEWPHRIGTETSFEYQTFDRETLMETTNVQNYITAFTVSHAPRLSAGVVWERTTDPYETDNPTTMDVETASRNWIGYTASYQYGNNHFLSLFYGKRRGGLTCSSGICYQVLDFEGLELMITSVF